MIAILEKAAPITQELINKDGFSLTLKSVKYSLYFCIDTLLGSLYFVMMDYKETGKALINAIKYLSDWFLSLSLGLVKNTFVLIKDLQSKIEK